MNLFTRRGLAALAAGAALCAQPALAQNAMNPNAFYFGGGVSSNEAPRSDDEVGFQVFGGYDTGARFGQAGVAIEAGFMRAGDFGGGDVDGIWATGVVDVELAPRWSAIGRLGLDFGDDDGLMAGAGLGYALSPNAEIRTEYVARDHIDSVQFNYVYRP